MAIGLWSILLVLGLSTSLNAQCDYEPDKKVAKLLASGLDKNNSVRERMEALQDAVDTDPECLPCRMALGEAYFERARTSTSVSYGSAMEQFQVLQDLCPGYHSDLSYYMGTILYSQEEWSLAASAFKTFLEFPMDDPAKLSRGYDRRLEDVREVLKEVEFNAQLFENPVPFDPRKVEGVSSTSDEYLPMLSPDNAYIYYTRKYLRKAKGDLYGTEVEEFTLSQRAGMDEPFNAGEPLPQPFNVGDNYGGASLSVNNKELYVTVCRPDRAGYTNCDIYVSHYETRFDERLGQEVTTWGELENLGPKVNSKDGWESQPSLSGDGNTLYFATARETSTENAEGGKSIDIYYSQRGEDGSWGQARPLDATINGPGNEKSPFMHADSKTMYFSSNGYLGAGGYDIYYSRLHEDGSWTKPKNIGLPINTSEDEHGLIVSTDGKLAYYASSKIRGSLGFDIYRFELPEQAKPDRVVLVKGLVTDENGAPAQDAKVMLNFVESRKVREVKVDRKDGAYATIINVEDEPVVLTVEKADHAFQAQLYTVEDAEQVVVEKDMTLEKVSLDKPYRINDIFYSTNSADIDEDSKAVLRLFADYLKKNPKLKIAIHGHTDNVGNPSNNLSLSTDRAFEVMAYLQGQGIAPAALSFKGFGETKPVASNSTAEGRAQNRRTEFIITAR
ncbi:MAG: OmpA family protein [Bacteroidetes bacterium]|nr:OmpA family protein [Bacteroidota bacterium]